MFSDGGKPLINTEALARCKGSVWTLQLFQQFLAFRIKPLKRLLNLLGPSHRAKATVLMKGPCDDVSRQGFARILTLPRVAANAKVHVPMNHVLKTARRFFAFAFFLLFLTPLHGAEPWQNALAQMPLYSSATELNRTNCVEILLAAFQSNDVVKALVFMPGATDEFYLFRRARAGLTNTCPTVFDAIAALTNQTFIRATFRSPLLLLHTDEDALVPDNTIQAVDAAERLQRLVRVIHLSCNDRDWDFLQPVLKRSLKLALRPWRYSRDSWHFYRHSFAAWNVDGLEALEIAAMAGKSKFTLRRREAVFEVDPRVRTAPKFDAHLR